MGFIKNEEKEIIGIFDIIKKRKFKGYQGQAVKNSLYSFSTLLISKLGSLIFTIIIARLLMPELFGLYSLALATMVLVGSFAELGVGQSLIQLVSNSLGKKRKKEAKIYSKHLFKIKIILTTITIVVFLLLARFISDVYYQKPIFLALLAGGLYILATNLLAFLQSMFQATNNFKHPLIKEVSFQVSRFVLVPVVILIVLKNNVSTELALFWLILAISAAYFIALITLFLFTNKKIPFLKVRIKKINKKQKKEVNKLMLPLSAAVLSGIFFGYIDIVMLGRFVSAENIGFYRAAFSLISAASVLIGFSIALFPIFSRLKGKQLENAFKKSVRINSIISVLVIIFTLIFANLIIWIVFGKEYSESTILLRILTPILLSYPLTSIYSIYFISKGKPNVVANLLILTTILNIALNYIVLDSLIKYGEVLAVIGVAIATVISRYVYLLFLMLNKKSK